MSGKVFEYVILHHSKPTKAEEETGKKPVTTMLSDIKRVVAVDDTKAAILAYRDIPEEYTRDGKLDEIEVVIRAF